MTHLEYLVEQAALLIEKGDATMENAILMAIKQDNERLDKTLEAMADYYRGYRNDRVKEQRAFSIILKSVHTKINAN